MTSIIRKVRDHFTCPTTDMTTTGTFTTYDSALKYQVKVMMWCRNQTPYMFAPYLRVISDGAGFYTVEHKISDSLVTQHVLDLYINETLALHRTEKG